MQQPRGAQRENGVRYGLLVSSLRECVPDTIFGPVVVGHRDAEHAILPQARRQALEEPFAIEGLLASAGKPRRLTRRIGKQRLGAQAERERGRREGQPCGFSRAMARMKSASRRAMRSRASSGWTARPCSSTAPCAAHRRRARIAPSNSHSNRRSGRGAPDALGSAGFEASETRRRRIGLARIGSLPWAIERSDDRD